MYGVISLDGPERIWHQSASVMYARVSIRGRLNRLRSAITGRPLRLLALENIDRPATVRDRHYAGIQTVRTDQVLGSEGRSADFDQDWNPLKRHSENRWIRVAMAILEGKILPPVKLIRIGDIYYVRDGHHRLSVARALGQRSIEAEVTVWEVQDTRPATSQAEPVLLHRPELEPVQAVACSAVSA